MLKNHLYILETFYKNNKQNTYTYRDKIMDKIMERPLICHTCVICIMTYKSDVLIILSDPCNLL